MTVGLIAAMVIATPLILAPVALVWYLTIGGAIHAVKAAHKEQAAEKVAA